MVYGETYGKNKILMMNVFTFFYSIYNSGKHDGKIDENETHTNKTLWGRMHNVFNKFTEHGYSFLSLYEGMVQREH